MLKKNENLSLIILSCIYSLIFNGILFYQATKDLNHTNIILSIIFNFTLSTLCIFLLLLSASFNKLLLRFISITLFCITSIIAYFVYTYQIKINVESLKLILQTNPEEAIDFFNINLLIWIILSVSICWLLIRNYKAFKLTSSKITCILLLLLIIIFQPNIICEQFFPFNIIKQVQTYIKEKYNPKTINNFTNEDFIFSDKPPQDLTIILIIGESARADHFHINGYHRNTSPNVEKIPNLLNFSNVRSCGNFTHISVPCLLTRATPKNLQLMYEEASIITIFNKLNFYTLWLGNQGGYFSLEDSFMRIAREAKDVIIPTRSLYGSNIDEALLPYLDKTLERHKNGNNFIIIHTVGSHYSYDKRYTEKFKRFTPTCKGGFFNSNVTNCTNEELNNSYDNSILYTDNFISEVINRLKNTNSLVIYVSDHGESLGENGVYLHGSSNADEQYKVPMFIWASEKCIENYSKNFKNAKAYTNKPISHDYIFHSILQMIGVQSDIIDHNLSLTRDVID